MSKSREKHEKRTKSASVPYVPLEGLNPSSPEASPVKKMKAKFSSSFPTEAVTLLKEYLQGANQHTTVEVLYSLQAVSGWLLSTFAPAAPATAATQAVSPEAVPSEGTCPDEQPAPAEAKPARIRRVDNPKLVATLDEMVQKKEAKALNLADYRWLVPVLWQIATKIVLSVG